MSPKEVAEKWVAADERYEAALMRELGIVEAHAVRRGFKPIPDNLQSFKAAAEEARRELEAI